MLDQKDLNQPIIDCLAENLTDKQALKRIEDFRPRLICFVVYGQNVNSGSTNMSGAVRLATYIKKIILIL